MFPVKLIAKNTIIASNHLVLYIKFLLYGVGDVSIPASIKVPTAIAVANKIKSIAVNLVENRILESFFNIITGFFKLVQI